MNDNHPDTDTYAARHLRHGVEPDVVAQVGTASFSSLEEAIEAGQGDLITVLKCCEVKRPIEIFTAGTTLDLNENTVVFKPGEVPFTDKHETSSSALLTITAPSTRIKNGRLGFLSNADDGICLKRKLHKSEVSFEDIGLAYEGAGHALIVQNGIAILQDSRIETSASGILLCSEKAQVGIVNSRIVAQRQAIGLNDGRLFAFNSRIAARDFDSIFAKCGYIGLYASEVASHRATAIKSTLAHSFAIPPNIQICECSEITSVLGYGLLIEGGNVTVLRSMVRSFGSTAVMIGKEPAFTPTSVSLVGGSFVSSWKSTGIQRVSGNLYLNNSRVESAYGSETKMFENLCTQYVDSSIFDLAEPVLD